MFAESEGMTLVPRGISGKGSLVETSLLKALVDFQFEVLTSCVGAAPR
ncbi:crotonobetainyl-CoA:carnitine CoA-transferase CaiB-like acyl-CoA transferase [Pararhizobium capsulatum DSM 1112]|uniref:Crotonobetainyl-CoA:carnitine CoA-transferase CaiB-like acyl-CoA transferase n=1 Tax=Pararhizobium capsulatum DSM 1112 TaxID=1121113 RepID=A0ABU0C0K6_9HYPH|nr:hypothetical protein [Pararhizobium capsulatum]MDQ0323210.1 crotonobetainyl-CoA:carnitine CoA-transferase CaiB-like acyl-CoA transferase [Pararhizobium capsulatum DSM 1112]